MIPINQFERLGWKVFAVATNGGTKELEFRGIRTFTLTNHADNFIYQNENNPKINEIVIHELKGRKLVEVYKGEPSDINEFFEVFNNLMND